MKSNTIEEHIDAKRKLAKTEKLQSKKSIAYLQKNSVDFKGSALALLLDKEQAKLAKDFIDLMSRHKFSDATPLMLKTKTSLKLLNLIEMGHDGARSRKLANRLFWSRLWAGKGYPIGVLAPKNTIFIDNLNCSLVYLCADLRLRVRRGTPIFMVGTSYASGAGSLPEKEMSNYKLYIGRFIYRSGDNDATFKEENLKSLLLTIAENSLLN